MTNELIKHVAPSPFPVVTARGKVIVDEVCECGERRSNHLDVMDAAWGHAHCPLNGCQKFRWAGAVLALEDDDEFIGLVETPELARFVSVAATAIIQAEREGQGLSVEQVVAIRRLYPR